MTNSDSDMIFINMNICKTITDKCVVLDLDETLVHVHDSRYDNPNGDNQRDAISDTPFSNLFTEPHD